MKISRSELKELVKECLIEILSEGIGNVASTSTVSSTKKISLRSQVSESNQARMKKALQEKATAQYRERLNQFSVNKPTEAPRVSQNIHEQTHQPQYNSSSVMNKSVLNAILEDTARNTLPKIMEVDPDLTGETFNANVLQQQEHFSQSPEELFGEESVEKWNHLAFS